MSLFVTEAFAMAPPQGAAGADAGAGSMLVQFLPLILMFVIFWFLLIRPQQKRAKEHKKMVSELKRGDSVVTSGGIIGRIVEIDEEYVVIESVGSKIQMLRSTIAQLISNKKSAADLKAEKKAAAAEKKSEVKLEKVAEPEVVEEKK